MHFDGLIALQSWTIIIQDLNKLLFVGFELTIRWAGAETFSSEMTHKQSVCIREKVNRKRFILSLNKRLNKDDIDKCVPHWQTFIHSLLIGWLFKVVALYSKFKYKAGGVISRGQQARAPLVRVRWPLPYDSADNQFIIDIQ